MDSGDVIGLAVVSVVALAAGSVIAWSLRLGISPMPSSARARDVMLRLIPHNPAGELHELGAGWGGVAIAMSRAAPDAHVVAWERSFVPWLVLRLRALRCPNLEVRRADYRSADFSKASVLVCYLFTGGMAALAEQLKRERSLVVVSSTFALPGFRPVETVTVDDLYRTKVYRYET